MSFSLEQFVSDARQAAHAPNALAATEALMADVFANPDLIVAGLPALPVEEVMLFEDNTVSIWHEMFLPTEELPPHDHQLPAIIGVYKGVERNRLFRQNSGKLVPNGSLTLGPGDIFVFGARDVHTVQALEGRPSYGLHVYLGALTKVERSLFSWESGHALPMGGEAFEEMKRPARD